MWKSDDEESNLLESVVNWAAPTPPPPLAASSTSVKQTVQMPLPPPSPFSDLFPQELLQSSGLLLSQFDDDVMNSRNSDTVDHSSNNRQETATSNSTAPRPPTGISSGVYRCAECKFSTDDRRLFMCHKRSKHAGEKTFSCPDCSAKFTRQYSLKKHVLQKHSTVCSNPSPQLPKYCPFPNCKFATRNPNAMLLHKRTHQQLYFCKECNSRYTRRQSLLGHLTKHHGSNAALIGMGPSLPITNTIDDQSLQSPPPRTNNVSSSATVPFFQEDAGSTSDTENSDGHGDQQDRVPISSTAPAFSHEEIGQSSTGIGSSKSSPQFSGMDPALESINAVVGSVVATVAANSEEQLDTKFFCDKCQFSANSLRRLYGHKLSSHRGAKEKMIVKASHHICPHCPRKFASLKRMLTHVKKIHTPSIKKQPKRSKAGGKRRQHSKRRASPIAMSCDRCDFNTSRKRIFAAHMKSHLTENGERHQDAKHDTLVRKSNPVIINKRFSPDQNVDATSTVTLPVSNSPSYTSAVSPNAYDFYHNGGRHTGSGSSTYSNGSVGEISAANNSFGQYYGVNRNSAPPSTNSFSSDHSISNNRLIRLDLNSQGNGGFEEMTACLQGLQQANGALMQLLRRRENELGSLRSNVVELLRLLLPNHQAFHHVLTLDNVDEMVTNTLTRILTDTASQR